MGMISENRKPLLILALCAVVAVLLLVLGVGLGQRDGGGIGSWQRRFGDAVSPAVLRPTDLSITSGSCSAADDRITVTGGCTIEVPAVGSTFSIKEVTRQAKLSVAGFPVVVEVVLGERRIAQTVRPGDDPVSLTFGRDGGTLSLQCGGFGPCIVVFA
jgi:hypothetical protein